jgi:hypothetical protein
VRNWVQVGWNPPWKPSAMTRGVSCKEPAARAATCCSRCEFQWCYSIQRLWYVALGSESGAISTAASRCCVLSSHRSLSIYIASGVHLGRSLRLVGQAALVDGTRQDSWISTWQGQ